MWLSGFGDVTVGTDDTGMPVINSPPSAVASTPDNLVSLAANVVDILHPYKTGVPVNVGIDPQTQSFLMMGGLLAAGLVILSMVGRRRS